MKWFFDAIDISNNINRGISAVRGYPPVLCYLTAACLGIICWALVTPIWYFDIEATMVWTDRAAAGILPPAHNTDWAPFFAGFVLSLTMLPTLIELVAVRFARANITPAAALVYTFSVFDMITDWPRVIAFVDLYQDALDKYGVFAPVVEWIFRILLLFMASFGFEAVFVVFATVAVFLLYQARRAYVVSARRA